MSDSLRTTTPRARDQRLLGRAADRLIEELGRRVRIGQLTIQAPDGLRRTFEGREEGPSGEIRIHDRSAVWRIILGGEPGAGEAFMEGAWSSPDLPAALRVAALNRASIGVTRGWLRVPLQLPRTIAHRARRNTLTGSRRNIEAHYDLGNDFYRLFLDETMTYSSAVFASPDQPLAEAQRNKYRIIAERAGLKAGMHVLEIGSGWGGFALYAAGELGCRVTTITISPSQHALATERIRAAGLADLVSAELRDYREVSGAYDAVVSIEMLEAVGADYFGAYFAAVDRALKPGGKASIQSICFPDGAYEPQRRGANWIQTYIFPGGLLPSMAVIERSLRDTRLLLTGTQDIAEHYVRTLAAWRTAFLAHRGEVARMGFDERFMRMWEYYLSLSEAGFATGLVQDQQFVLEKRRGVA
ncbi:MAG: cyclopropane-fatty-acyl-phospholipid synthase family protein [Chloroflexota bacterium]